MKSLLLSIMLAGSALAGVKEKTLDAIQFVESSNNSKAIGDNGKAVGAYQLHKVMVREVNRINKREGKKARYNYADRLNPVKSREMTKTFLNFQSKRYELANGKKPHQVLLAASWNTGSINKKPVAKYIQKIIKELNK